MYLIFWHISKHWSIHISVSQKIKFFGIEKHYAHCLCIYALNHQKNFRMFRPKLSGCGPFKVLGRSRKLLYNSKIIFLVAKQLYELLMSVCMSLCLSVCLSVSFFWPNIFLNKFCFALSDWFFKTQPKYNKQNNTIALGFDSIEINQVVHSFTVP